MHALSRLNHKVVAAFIAAALAVAWLAMTMGPAHAAYSTTRNYSNVCVRLSGSTGYCVGPGQTYSADTTWSWLVAPHSACEWSLTGGSHRVTSATTTNVWVTNGGYDETIYACWGT